jgi:hypothetical protein
MNLIKLTVASTPVALLTAFSILSLAQGPRPTGPGDFKIRAIRQQQINAPNYSGSGADLGGRPSTLWRSWLKIEVQFESQPEWADDVQVKYFVLIGKGRDVKLFSGEVTHINVAKGSQHYSAMFMHPNTLRRYGAGQIEAVAVQIFHQNRLMDQTSEPPARDRWWEQYTPVSGYLLAPQDTPWSVIADERFEAVKHVARP